MGWHECPNSGHWEIGMSHPQGEGRGGRAQRQRPESRKGQRGRDTARSRGERKSAAAGDIAHNAQRVQRGENRQSRAGRVQTQKQG